MIFVDCLLFVFLCSVTVLFASHGKSLNKLPPFLIAWLPSDASKSKILIIKYLNDTAFLGFSYMY